MSRKIQSEIIIPNGITIWPHELKSAQALARAGYTVEFIVQSNRHKDKSPDVIIDQIK